LETTNSGKTKLVGRSPTPSQALVLLLMMKKDQLQTLYHLRRVFSRQDGTAEMDRESASYKSPKTVAIRKK
jgi:hypothetical protein